MLLDYGWLHDFDNEVDVLIYGLYSPKQKFWMHVENACSCGPWWFEVLQDSFIQQSRVLNSQFQDLLAWTTFQQSPLTYHLGITKTTVHLWYFTTLKISCLL
ncbi:hypothetical protein TNCV_694111 [Trichonephila clavipes]|nr:hypothetical protein TNCV_694111 [Trichonephila clavipes]